MKTIKVKYSYDIPDNFTGIAKYEDKTEVWFKNGKWHREDGGPAKTWEDGSVEYYINGKLHREDGGPAVEYPYGYKAWYQHDKNHRTDGPAIIHKNGETEYWINGIKTYKEAVEVYKALFSKKDLELI
jgi:hypothetical protein